MEDKKLIGERIKLEREKYLNQYYKLSNDYNSEIAKINEKFNEIEKECKHKYEWINTDPYNEICRCIYCDKDGKCF